MIDGFEVLNYRSIVGRGPNDEGTPAELKIEEDITTLIGKNEAGKSNLLRAINRFRDPHPLADRNFSNYANYPDQREEIEILRCRLSAGALDHNAEQVKPVSWLIGPYRCEDLDGFPVRESLNDIDVLTFDQPDSPTQQDSDVTSITDEGPGLPLGQALATGHVEIIHYAGGEHKVDIVDISVEEGTESHSIPSELDLPLSIDDFLSKRLNEHLRLCRWFVRNIVEVASVNPEIRNISGIDDVEINDESDLLTQLNNQLESISDAFTEAEPIEKTPADTHDEAAFDPPEIPVIQKSANDLLRSLNNIDNTTDPAQDLPNIVDQSDIDLAESEYDLREEKEDPVLKGILALDDIDLANHTSFDSSEFKSSLDNACEELTRYLNGFWDFNTKDRQPQETIKPEDTDRYTFGYELNRGTLKLELAEGDSPPTPLGQRSDGMRWIVTFLLTIIAQPYAQSEGRQTLVTLDDPGIHLHPEAEKRLFRAFFYVTNQAQIVYTTHSPALIDRKEVDRLRIVRHMTHTQGNGVTGTTVANSLDDAKTDGEQVDPLATAREAVGWTLSDSLFRGKQTILVEGPSDKRYLNLFNSFFHWNGNTCLDEDPTFVDSKGGQLPFLSRILAAENVTHVALMDDDTAEKDFEQELEERTVRYDDLSILDTAEYEAEIEDLFDRKYLIESAAEVHNELDAEAILDTPYDRVPVNIVDYIENFLEKADGPDELQKKELSRKIKDKLQSKLRNSPEAHSETIDRFQAVISELKSTLEGGEME